MCVGETIQVEYIVTFLRVVSQKEGIHAEACVCPFHNARKEVSRIIFAAVCRFKAPSS